MRARRVRERRATTHERSEVYGSEPRTGEVLTLLFLACFSFHDSF